MRTLQIAPSILSADFSRLGEQAQAALDAGAQLLHVDVMDGHFVPNITLGPPLVKSLRKAVKGTLDCHLMIENADRYIPAFAEAGADWISVHQEACIHLHRSIELIKQQKCKAGVVINPATPAETLLEVLEIVDFVLVMSVNPGFGGQQFIASTLDKVRKLAAWRERRRLAFQIEIDGGMDLQTIGDAARAGVDVFVAGNAVFGSGQIADNVRALAKAAHDAVLLKA